MRDNDGDDDNWPFRILSDQDSRQRKETFTMKLPPSQLFLSIIFFASFVQHVNFLVIARKAFFEKVKV